MLGRNDAGIYPCSKASPAPRSPPAAPASSRSTAAAGRRCCSCTATRLRMSTGTRWRRGWRMNSPSCAQTCAATAIPRSRMAALGFTRFAAAGHDRGARVLHRMCLDHPSVVTKAAILDIIPQHHLLNNVTRDWGRFSWHWFFMIQPYDFPERLMSADPDYFIRRKLAKTKQGLSFFDEPALAEYIRCFKNPATVHAMCEDYRATFGIDLDMDTKDFAAGRKITCPVLLLWGATGGVGRHHDSMAIWPRYAADIKAGKALPSGHYLADEAPDETYAELRAFFAAGA